MQRCSQLMTVFLQTPGHSSVTQNLTIIKKSQLVTITSADYDEKSLNNEWFSQMGQNNIAK